MNHHLEVTSLALSVAGNIQSGKHLDFPHEGQAATCVANARVRWCLVRTEAYRIVEIATGKPADQTLVVCVNGNESEPWQKEKAFLQALEKHGCTIVVIDPRGVGSLKPKMERPRRAISGHHLRQRRSPTLIAGE